MELFKSVAGGADAVGAAQPAWRRADTAPGTALLRSNFFPVLPTTMRITA